jgi:hypothetical protein
MEEQENELFGNLFGTINILSEQHLDAILMSMDKDHALFYIIESVKASHKRGAFTIGESEVISKAIRVLSKIEEPNQTIDK